MNSHRPGTALNSEALEARFALRATAHLTAQADALPQDITERLRVAREQAIQRARAVRTVAAPQAASSRQGNTLTWPGASQNGGSGWWVKLGAIIPLVALLAGLMLIQDWHGSNQVSAAAEIDASLLSDDLPPSAYSDPGFVEFLRSPQD
jgi:hypothetical protein